MKNISYILIMSLVMMLLAGSCTNQPADKKTDGDDFTYLLDKFADIQVLKYQLPAFEELSLKQKEFIYYLSEAAISGRDILWDQNFKYNLRIRKCIENIISTYDGDKDSEDYKTFIIYAKRVFFANGIHHHYSTDKFEPGFSEDYFRTLIEGADPSLLPISEGETIEGMLDVIIPAMFDNDLYAKRIELGAGKDIIAESACNFYDGLNQKEVEKYYSSIIDTDDPRPVSYGLNSKLLKVDGEIFEDVYKIDGLYGEAIEKIVYWLERAAVVAETEKQKEEVELLIEYYKSGSLKTWDDYNVVWAGNIEPMVDFINGFIEVYGDPRGMKATWESVVNYKDIEASKRTIIISENAQWFEDHSPISDAFKKEEVKGVAGKVINVAMLGGDCYPASPIGINLPNADWIRKDIGSKSVTLANISNASYMASQGSGFLKEFAASDEEIARAKEYGALAGNMHTDLHEILGHGSGKLLEGTDPNALANYSSALEEARADLFALYYMIDEKVVELGLLPARESAMAVYDGYLRNGLMTQLVRIKPGKNIEQAHMRNRSIISHWVYEKGKDENIVEMFKRDGKTYVKINDYDKLRGLFGELLAEVQRMKSEGDYEAGKALVEDYGIRIDQELHAELLERYRKLDLAPYSGYVNPLLTPLMDDDGNITDVRVEYAKDYLSQMMRYGKDYAFLKY